MVGIRDSDPQTIIAIQRSAMNTKELMNVTGRNVEMRSRQEEHAGSQTKQQLTKQNFLEVLIRTLMNFPGVGP